MTRPFDRRSFLRAGLGAAALGSQALASPAYAQAWPLRPIRMVVGFPPGGITDLFARAYGDALSQSLGQPIVIENKAGAGSLIAGELVAKAPPDGYTLLFTIQGALVQGQALYKKLPYDPGRDFTYISAFSNGQLPLAVHKDLPVRTVSEFVEFAKKNPVNFGSYSPGSYGHLVVGQLNKLYGTRIEPVHYKGEAPMWPELAAGRLHAAVGSYAGVAPYLKSGAARAIAVATLSRSPKLPDVPTYAEQGFRDPIFTMRGWLGLLGPAGMPRDIVDRISKNLIAAVDTPRVKQLQELFGIPEAPTTPEEFVRLYREEGPVWIAMTRELGVSLD
jgi:tripartite-type tricarboxylate transporter receptor subunit TctC